MAAGERVTDEKRYEMYLAYCILVETPPQAILTKEKWLREDARQMGKPFVMQLN